MGRAAPVTSDVNGIITMIKLLLCLVCSLLLGIIVLQLRQQRLDLNYQVNQLHNKIEGQQSLLWSQQLQIATVTAPNAIQNTVESQDLKMVPQSPSPAAVGYNTDAGNPDAE
jgi:cell division protein FtsL